MTDLAEPTTRSEPPVSRVGDGVSKVVLITAALQIIASLGMILLLFLEWVKGGNIGLSGNGGGGFGILALITALVALYAAAQAVRGKSSERSLIGANQMTMILAIALFFSNLVFLWVFRTGGAPKWIYVTSNLVIYVSVVGLFASKPDTPEPLDDGEVRRIGVATVVLGALIALAPALAYTELGSRTLTGYEPGAPRIGILLLLVGAATIYVGAQRIVGGAAHADMGPYVLWPHVNIALGIIATAPAFAWTVSGLWGNDFDPGYGVYVSLLFGFALTGLGFYEAAKRGARGI
ncbi:MAG: hypothetical protein AB8G26_16395 [Ilumatobacter sp.]